MLGWVGKVRVNDLDRAAQVLDVRPDMLLRALFCAFHNVENIDSDSIAELV